MCNFRDCYGVDMQVKIETDSNDATEMKTEADITECPQFDNQQSCSGRSE